MARPTELMRELDRLKSKHGVEIHEDRLAVTVWQFTWTGGCFGIEFELHHWYPNGMLEVKVVRRWWTC